MEEQTTVGAGIVSVLITLLTALLVGAIACVGWIGVQTVLGKGGRTKYKTIDKIIVKMGELTGVCDQDGKPYEDQTDDSSGPQRSEDRT